MKTAALVSVVLASSLVAARPDPAAVRQVLAHDHFNGSVLVADARGVVLSTGPRTVYDIGSVAKLFTAAAVLSLDQIGKLRLDAPISSYLQEARPTTGSITIRELLTHTSGLPGEFSSDLDRLTVTQAVSRVLNLPLRHRGQFVYSNAGYVLLAAIVQRVAHESFEAFVRTRLLRRAGLTATGWYGDPVFGSAKVSHGYVGTVDRGAAGARPLSWSIIGAGGMLSTTRDLYWFVRALDAGRLLDRVQTSELLRGYVPLPGRRGVDAGFGGVVAVTKRGSVFAVGGGTDFGFTADVRRFTPQHIVTIVLANSDRAPAVRVGFDIARALGF